MEGGNGVGAARRFEGAGADAARRYRKLQKWSETDASEKLSSGSSAKCHSSVCSMDQQRWRWKVSRSTTSLLLEAHDKIGESPYKVFRLRVEKGERTAAYTRLGRELFEKAVLGQRPVRLGTWIPDVEESTSWTKEKSNLVGSCQSIIC